MEEKIEDRKVELAKRLKNLLENYSETQQEIKDSLINNLELAKKENADSILVSEIERLQQLQEIDDCKNDIINPYYISQNSLDKILKPPADMSEIDLYTLLFKQVNRLINLVKKKKAGKYIANILSIIESGIDEGQISHYLYEFASDLYDAQDSYKLLHALKDDLMYQKEHKKERLVRICYEKEFVRILYVSPKSRSTKCAKDKYKIKTYNRLEEGEVTKGFTFLERLLIYEGEYVPYTNLLKKEAYDDYQKAHNVSGNINKMHLTLDFYRHEIKTTKSEINTETNGVLASYYDDSGELLKIRSKLLFPSSRNFDASDNYRLNAHRLNLKEYFSTDTVKICRHVDGKDIESEVYRFINKSKDKRRKELCGSQLSKECVFGKEVISEADRVMKNDEAPEVYKIDCRACK